MVYLAYKNGFLDYKPRGAYMAYIDNGYHHVQASDLAAHQQNGHGYLLSFD
jgi:hypothetical protein